MKPRRIAIATGTRADWGLLSTVASALRDSGKAEILVVATNMHLDSRRGNTIKEIANDGFEVAATVPMPVGEDTGAGVAKAMADCTRGFAEAFEKLNPDSLIILGDRYEMLSVASVATVMRIPIIHIAGGEISEGAIDDNIRHAITKLSSLHLTATENYRQRIIAMGEQPDRVINTGAIGVYKIMNTPLMDKETLDRELGFRVDENTILVTLHPATAGNVSTPVMTGALLDALSLFPDNNILFTYPNNDADGDIIIRMIEEYGSTNPERVRLVPSMGHIRYLSVLRYIAAVVGNSSSGIVEVPSIGIPVVNIRPRQNGRLVSEAVINADPDRDSIAEAIRFALSGEGKEIAGKTPNPYFRENTLEIMTDAILSVSPENMKNKFFYDIEHPFIK